MTGNDLYPRWVWVIWILGIPLAAAVVVIAVFLTTDSSALPLDHPELWWLGLAVPIAALIYLLGVRRRRRDVHRFTSLELSSLLVTGMNPARQAFRGCLAVLAIAALVVAIIGPRWNIYLEKQNVQGMDVVVALDVSKSMLANDVLPNRLENAKRQIRQQLTERTVLQRVSRLGLLAFAGTTSLRVPLSTDQLAFRTKLEQTHVGTVPKGGTAIGEAIVRAADLFERSTQEATKVLLVFTDGEDHAGGPVEAAKNAFGQHGIRVFTVGVGDPSRAAGAQVLADTTAAAKPLLHDGQIVFSKIDVAGLRQIAEAGGGQYAPLDDLHALVDAVAGMRKANLGVDERMRHRPRYQWFLLASLLLLMLETIIAERSASADVPLRRIWEQEVAA